MSDDERWRGKFEILDVPNSGDFTKEVQWIEKNLGLKVTYEDYGDNDFDMYAANNKAYRTRSSGVWVKFIEQESFHDEPYYCTHSKNNDGTIDFSCCFYNGSTDLGEHIDEIVDKINEEAK